ncbi:hypothetical protein D6C99_01375, partial [Aureobasidium pullulans]
LHVSVTYCELLCSQSSTNQLDIGQIDPSFPRLHGLRTLIFPRSTLSSPNLYVLATLASLTESRTWGMEYHHDRDQQYYRQDVLDEQNQTTQISAQYNSSALMSTARFKVPQLPQRSIPRTTAQSLPHSSYLGAEQSVSSPLHDGLDYPGATSINSTYQNGYGSLRPPSTSPSFESAGFTYGYQQAQQIPISNDYAPHNMRSMSMSSHYDIPQASQSYASTAYPYHNLSSSTAELGMYEPMSIDHQEFQAPQIVSGNSYQGYAASQPMQQQSTTQQNNTNVREYLEQYQMRIREIFTLVKNHQLKPTADLLLQVSRFLIGNVEALGLDRDDKSQYANRLELWDIFNACWLTVLQLQYKKTHMMMCTAQELPPGQSILDADTIEILGQEIVKLCDGIEKTGLVDYQMGVAEERIISKMLRPQSHSTPRASGSSASVSASASGSRS